MPIPVEVKVHPDPSIPETAPLAQGIIEGHLIDINRFGMGLMSQTSLPKGALVDLEFPRSALPLPSAAPPKGNMHATGRIVYTAPQGDRYRVGISFLRLDEIDQYLLHEMTSGRERRRAPRITLTET